MSYFMFYSTNLTAESPHSSIKLAGAFILWFLCSSFGTAHSAGFAPPEECRDYIGDEHLKCLYTHIYLQDSERSESETRLKKDMPAPVESRVDQFDSMQPVPDESMSPSAQSMAARQQSSEMTAPSFRAPEECRAYSGNAHLNCLYAYIELQRGKAGRVEEDLRAQKEMLSQLNETVNRQAAANRNVEQRLSEREASASSPPVYVAPPFYPGYGYPGYYYPRYYYPSPGVSLYLGLPGFYYGRPYYGHRFFGHRR